MNRAELERRGRSAGRHLKKAVRQLRGAGFALVVFDLDEVEHTIQTDGPPAVVARALRSAAEAVEKAAGLARGPRA